MVVPRRPRGRRLHLARCSRRQPRQAFRSRLVVAPGKGVAISAHRLPRTRCG